MKIKIVDKVLNYENKLDLIDELFQQINQLLEKENYYFSYLIVDNVEVYNDFETYFSENIKTIENVVVKVSTKKEFQNELFLSIESYLKRAIPEMNVLVESFYQGANNDSWENFSDFVEGVQWIVSAIITIDEVNNHPDNWNSYLEIISSLEYELGNLHNALENKDEVLIADIIQYEIIPKLQSLEGEITSTIDEEGVRIDIS